MHFFPLVFPKYFFRNILLPKYISRNILLPYELYIRTDFIAVSFLFFDRPDFKPLLLGALINRFLNDGVKFNIILLADSVLFFPSKFMLHKIMQAKLLRSADFDDKSFLCMNNC